MELKEAIEIIKKEVVRSGGKYSVLQKCEACDTLISLAEKVLEIGGVMPKRKEHYAFLDKEGKEHRTVDDWRKEGFNEAIDQCTLAVTGMLAEKDKYIEGLRPIIQQIDRGVMDTTEILAEKDKKIAELEKFPLYQYVPADKKIAELETALIESNKDYNMACCVAKERNDKIAELERQVRRMESPLNGICKGEKCS